jgi:hypothetical protein
VGILITRGVPNGDEAYSSNSEYSVELAGNREEELLVAVFQHRDGNKTLVWSRLVAWPEHQSGLPGLVLGTIKAHITNDGKTVVLRDKEQSAENGVQIVGAGDTEVIHLHPFSKELTFMAPGETTRAYANRPSLRSGARYWYLPALLDFVLPDQSAYAIWFGQTDRWLLISLKDYKPAVVQDQQQIAFLNDLAREKIEPLLEAHQPMPLRRAINAIKGELAKIAPALVSPAPARWSNPQVMTAYLFLSARRNPSDKPRIENLVRFPIEGVQVGTIRGPRTASISFIPRHSERIFGDFFLRRWNGETNIEAIAQAGSLMIPDDDLNYSGGIELQLELPFPVSDPRGARWAYLFPSSLPPGKWTGSSGVVTFWVNLNQSIYPNKVSFNRVVPAVFRAIIPGEYRLKFVWERRTATSTGWTNEFYSAMPGDYQSAESAPFIVEAGEVVSNLSIACTNRVGGAGAYAEDDAALKHAKAE